MSYFTIYRRSLLLQSSLLRSTPKLFPQRYFSITSTHAAPSSPSSSSSSSSSPPPQQQSQPSWTTQPSPPKLPKDEQEIFDTLQKSSTGAFSTMKSDAPPTVAVDEPEALLNEHPNLRRGERPLFEGTRNPKTGETGGPKTDPLKYGDYAYNGRVTDF